jgi:hypothetical protein
LAFAFAFAVGAAPACPVGRAGVTGVTDFVAFATGFGAAVVGLAAGATDLVGVAAGFGVAFMGCDNWGATRLIVVVACVVVWATLGASANATPEERVALVGCAATGSAF